MAKTYIDIVKYMVEASFDISGLVDKPDIIGAVFGQTEGLLGSDLDLRELQKNGKIGRIEINSSATGSRTTGKLYLPSSLGRVETCILAAAIESVDRVGPFETSFKINKIDDTRNEKRKKIIGRAKELVKGLISTGVIPDSRELSDLVESDVKASVVTSYGQEQLAAGPDIDTSDDIVLVEGRADVIALLRSDISNCIAVGGATGTIPKTIVNLIATKETTLFLDGDRGGDMILKSIMNVGEIDFVARAPAGKEVEELTRKEIIKALRSRIPIEQVFPNLKKNGNGNGEQKAENREEQHDRYQQRQPPQQQQRQRMPQQPRQQFAQRQQQQQPVLSPSSIVNNLTSPQRSRTQPQTEDRDSRIDTIDSDLDIKDLRERRDTGANPVDSIPSMYQQGSSGTSAPNQVLVSALDQLHNTLRGRLYDKEGKMISEIPISDLIHSIEDGKNVYAVVFDGVITQRLVELANKYGVREVYGIRATQISRNYDTVYLFTKEHGKIS
ncbi:MAG: DNA primase DnaG [Candidatus Marsarchaeota archaeon]|nr:DNA primase DnaG [Candidatus Marsarchaeota archaeon]